MSKFQEGDIVEAFGFQGIVQIDRQGLRGVTNPIRVDLGPSVIGVSYYFTEEGQLETWHKEPSLKLIERPNKPKKKVKKWVNLYKPGVWGGNRHWIAWDAKFDADAADKASSRKRIACVEIEVEEE